VDLPRSYTIRESSHRIHNPFTSDKLATLGQALSPRPGTRMLDLACGTGEMLCTWARDHQVTGTGIDISTVFIAAARARAVELGVDDQVRFVHGDASGQVASEPVGIASCVGATWIGGGVPGTVELLRQSLQPGGVMLIGEPYWRQEPPDQATVEGCHAIGSDDFLPLPELIERFTTSPARYARYQREYLGWGVSALMNRFDGVAGLTELSSFGEAAAAVTS
jgi:SAM-dependent methyltransferase